MDAAAAADSGGLEERQLPADRRHVDQTTEQAGSNSGDPADGPKPDLSPTSDNVSYVRK